MQALVIRISRDVYVLDNTVNFMLNKRKSKKAAGASPQTPLGELSALPQNPLAVTGGGAPPPVPSPSFEYVYQTPPFPKSWIRPWLSLREKWAEQRSYQNLLWIGRMEHGLHATMVQSSGKCALTLHSRISVTDKVKINELNTSIATGPLYVHTEFEAIKTLLAEDVAVLNPWGIGLRSISKELVPGPKIRFPVVTWCSMKC